MSFFSLVWKMHQLCPLDAHIQFLKQHSQSIFVYLTVNQDRSGKWNFQFYLSLSYDQNWTSGKRKALYKKLVWRCRTLYGSAPMQSNTLLITQANIVFDKSQKHRPHPTPPAQKDATLSPLHTILLTLCVCAHGSLCWLCFVLCFVMGCVFQFGEIAHTSVRYYYHVFLTSQRTATNWKTGGYQTKSSKFQSK